MQDRVSLYPGRVTLTPVAGQANTYDMVRADQPTQEGTQLNKGNLLSDETEVALFGAAANRTVNQAFAGIGFRFKLIESATAAVTVTVKDSSGLAAKDVNVAGMFDEAGGAVYTNSSGVAAGYVAEGNVTLSVSGYADIEDASDTFTAVAGGSYTKTITVTRRTYLKLLSSASFRFSGNVATVDVALGGGGASGQAGQGEYSDISSARRIAIGGSGGGPGSVSTRTGIVPEARKVYAALVGAGGAANGNAGGASSFMGVSASGGSVSGGGTGGRFNPQTNPSVTTNPTAGAAGTGVLYASMTETFLYGGAGGGGGASSGNFNFSNGNGFTGGESGGTPAGGAGGSPIYGQTTSTAAGNGTDGLGGGGGGGASVLDKGGANYASSVANYPGGKGGSGCITMRIHLEAA